MWISMNVLGSNSSKDEYSTHIDMMLNPEKVHKYKLDVEKTEHDLRWMLLNMSLELIVLGKYLLAVPSWIWKAVCIEN